MHNWLNYHHLFYFWAIARESSVSSAAEKLRISQPTLSAQLKQLENAFEHKLFDRQGRSLHLTEMGRITYRYADEIFALGEELKAALRGNTASAEITIRVGITSSLPKLISHLTLEPLRAHAQKIKVICYEGKREELLKNLASHELDLVLADAPFHSEVAVKAYNHRLGSSGISLCGTKKLLKSLSENKKERFHDVPFILPTTNTMLRRAVDEWFEMNNISPVIVAEFEDSALLKTFGAEGYGLFPVPSVVQAEVEKKYDVALVEHLKGVKEEFYAISLQRKVTHPAVALITTSAREIIGEVH